jgi:cytochrome P450
MSSLPLPPGRAGLPFLGETLSLLPDIFGFIHEKVAQHGPVSRTRVLGQEVVVLAGPEATALFYDNDLIQREGAFPDNVLQLFGGGTARILPVLDGAEHLLRKQLTLQAFNLRAVAGYMPVLDAAVKRGFDRWVQPGGEFGWQEELMSLAIEGVAACLFGFGPGPEVDQLAADYRIVTAGFAGLPIPVPGTAFSKALKARDRILAMYDRLARERQAKPTGDGLSQLLAARGPGGESLAVESAALELHHVFLAGYIIFAAMESIVLALAQKPELKGRLLAELQAQAPSGPLDPMKLRQMPLLLQTAMEAKRVPEIVPITFGKAKKGFDVLGHHVPEGWLVFLAVTENNRHATAFAQPHSFDPDRFSAPRQEQSKPFAYVPQGAGEPTGHKCLGFDFSTAFLEIFTAQLVRDHEYTVPEQPWTMKRNLVPPEYESGLRAVVRRRQG